MSDPAQDPTARPFECPLCGKRFASKRSENEHVLVTHHVGLLINEMSEILLINVWTFNRAVLIGLSSFFIQQNAGLHKCSYCTKTFRKNSELQRHERTHTVSDRPFSISKAWCTRNLTEPPSFSLRVKNRLAVRSVSRFSGSQRRTNSKPTTFAIIRFVFVILQIIQSILEPVN